MKLRKKLEKKIITHTKIKERYLRDLSIEMIKRGISNNEIKTLLDEVAISLDEFITETKPENIENLEETFGSTHQFCDNNMLLHSKEGALGQSIYNIIIILSIFIVPFLGLASCFMFPYNYIMQGLEKELLGVAVANSGNGFLGTLFGLSAFSWMLSYHFRRRFSKYDFRENIKLVLLILNWFIFIIWLILAILPYAISSNVIAEIWHQGLHLLILNNALRWIALGVFLGIIAIQNTFVIKNKGKKKKLNHGKEKMSDSFKVIFIFFILSGFVIPNPGMGLLLIFIGIQILLFARITSGTWLVGSLAILTQIAVIFQDVYRASSKVEHTQIIFGLKFSFIGLGREVTSTIIISVVFLILWSSICWIKIKKRQEKILPKITFPKNKKAILSIILLILIIFSTSGSRPQYTIIPHKQVYEADYSVENKAVWDQNFLIPAKGTVYISIYTYIELNGSFYQWSKILEGRWSLIYEEYNRIGGVYRAFYGDFGVQTQYTHEGETKKRYYNETWKVSVEYITFKAKGEGHLTSHMEWDTMTMGRLFPNLKVVWISKVPQFPFWLEIMIVGVTITSFFLTWEKKKLIKPRIISKEDRK